MDTTKEIVQKVTKILTLSVYDFGYHIVNGETPKKIFDKGGSGHTSFAESMNPVHAMIEEFDNLPTGTKIRVTMEAVQY